jgi:hypothetical protein
LFLDFLTKRSSAMRNLRHALLSARTGFLFLMLVAVFGALSTLTPLSGASSPPLTITVVNNSAWEIRSLYLSPVNNDNWGLDQLNESPISPGATRTLDVSWDQSTVKLVGEDQDGCFLSTTVEAAGNPVWTIASDATRNCGG